MPIWCPYVLSGLAYLLGGISTGYWLVRWRTGLDVRTQGSGTTGATNVGRVLGPVGFVTVSLTDLLKGALIALVAKWLGLSQAWTFAVVLAVVAGHVWPIQLGFRGGKGVAPVLGGWLVLAPWALVPCLVVMLIALVALRRFTPAGLCGLAILPAATWWDTGGRIATVLAFIALAVLFYSHRQHLSRLGQPHPAVR